METFPSSLRERTRGAQQFIDAGTVQVQVVREHRQQKQLSIPDLPPRQVLAFRLARNYTRNEHAPGFARLYARVRLGEWHLHHMTDPVQQVVSELTANAVLHSGGENVMVWFTLTDTSVIVYVWDANPRPPVQRDPSETDEDGRGLSIVSAFSARTGWYPYAGGKTTYAEVMK